MKKKNKQNEVVINDANDLIQDNQNNSDLVSTNSQTNRNQSLFGNPNPEVWKEENKEVLVAKQNKAKKTNKKAKEIKNNQTQKSNVFKKFFLGIGKEFERVTWTSRKKLAFGFLITIVVVVFFAIIFTLISVGVTSI
ncbi:MAG: preprotein translocase subunit SecE [Malacoplasma sp.]|nr:preprotein translocase subunit SecE [Malacoplasma sp.]